MKTAVLYAMFCAVMFGGWPLVAKVSKVGGWWIPALVSGATFLVCLWGLFNHPSPAGRNPIAICMAAGVMNGLGTLVFGAKLIDSKTPASFILPFMMALCPVVSGLGGVLLFNEGVTPMRFGSLLVLSGSIFLFGWAWK